MHLAANVLVHVIENGNILNPTVSVRLIDYGNAFDMEAGKLESRRGLTGSDHFLPP